MWPVLRGHAAGIGSRSLPAALPAGWLRKWLALADAHAVAYRCGGSTGWPVRRAAGKAPCFPLNCPFARDEMGEHLERARV